MFTIKRLILRRYVMLCLILTVTPRTRQDCLVLSCRWCEQNWRRVKTVFSIPLLATVSSSFEIFIADSLDLPPILFIGDRRHGQVASVVWTMHKIFDNLRFKFGPTWRSFGMKACCRQYAQITGYSVDRPVDTSLSVSNNWVKHWTLTE